MKNLNVNKRFLTLALTATLVLSGSINSVEIVNSKEIDNVGYNKEQTTEENQQELIEIKPIELVVKEGTKLRKEANNDSKTIATISKGKILESIDHKKEWYTVLYNDEIAYVNDKYVYEEIDKNGKDLKEEKKEIDGIEVERTTYVKSKTDLNIRSNATTKSKIIGYLSEGDKLEAKTLLKNGWYEVKYKGKSAYVNGKYVKKVKKDKIISPFDKIVKFDQKSDIYSNKEKSKVSDTVPSYEIAYVYKEYDDTYLANVNGELSYVDKDDTSDLAKKIVIVDISDQNAKLYDGNKVIVDTPVVTGKDSTPTNVGYFDIDDKEKNAILRGSDYASLVDYWMPFNEDEQEGLHDAECHNHYDENGNNIKKHGWRTLDSFGTNEYHADGSHGCVNLPNAAAKKIYNNVEVGTRVLVKK